MKQELFYLKDTRTNKYHSLKGLTSNIEDAQQFTELQLKRRLNVPVSYKEVFKEKMANSNLLMEPVFEQEASFKIVSDIPYDDDDILLCDAKYWYGKTQVSDLVVYCVNGGEIRTPKGNNKTPDRILFKVKSKHGKRNP